MLLELRSEFVCLHQRRFGVQPVHFISRMREAAIGQRIITLVGTVLLGLFANGRVNGRLLQA